MTSKLFLEKLNSQYEKALPFVAYSKPNLSKVKGILQKNDNLFFSKNFKESGFIFAPFDANEKSIIIPTEDSKIIDTEILGFENFDYNEIEEINNTSHHQHQKERYQELVRKTIEEIKANVFKKVVISREERINLKDKNIITIFLKLLSSYKNALVYCFYHPKVGIWLGATPETFLSINGRQFKTMSLAGTKTIGDVKKWGEKELEEQQLVTDYITHAVGGLIRNIQVSDVETSRAGDLLHLKTTLSGILNFESSDLKILLNKLHPTPAVCGLPKEASKTFILENEGYNREYYTGFIGELNYKSTKSRNSNSRNVENNAYTRIKNTSNLYVNLRCMQIKGDDAIIYVGGGITKDSIPEKEWEETINKSHTMKKVLY